MRILVAGAGGFIGGHLVKRLLARGDEVRAVDVKPLEEWHQIHTGAENLVRDLSLLECAQEVSRGMDWVFNHAADMGGMGFIENNKALCMLSSLINTHLLMAAKEANVQRYFFASSACVYASWHQRGDGSPFLSEDMAYPADPEDGYGWEKLFAERMCRHFEEDFGLEVRIARYHNVYGPQGTYKGGREKAPAAAARKVAEVAVGMANKIEIWGDGSQVRSFTFIDDCVDGTLALMNSAYSAPINIGSAEFVTIQELYDLTVREAGLAEIEFEYVLTAPLGVAGRSSDNARCIEVLNWEPKTPLVEGMRQTYAWVLQQMQMDAKGPSQT